MLLSRLRPSRSSRRRDDKAESAAGSIAAATTVTMAVGRVTALDARQPKGGNVSSALNQLDDFLEKRDYTGAIALLEHDRKNSTTFAETSLLWLGYCYFHAGDYQKSCEIYEALAKQKNCPQETNLYIACCLFFMAVYDEAQRSAEKVIKSPLQNRLLFHVAHKLKDEPKLMIHHSQLTDTVEDQLCLASIHYLRNHYQEAIDIYKKVLSKNPTFVALNVYLALCYYKLDYYDVSMEVLQSYLNRYSDSVTVVNLKACNQYRLYNSKAAETELKKLHNNVLVTGENASFAKDIVTHNSVVFRNGDAALQVLPALVDIIPEARLNLVIYHLKKNDTDAAFMLMHQFEPQTIHEYLLKAITLCVKGNDSDSKDYLKEAAYFFKYVGESSTECDTIIGRQSMASSFFLCQQYEEVLVYLDSIKTFFPHDDIFNFNYGQTQLMCGNFAVAESALLLVIGDDFTSTAAYYSCLARAYIANRKSKLAWGLFQRAPRHLTADELFQLLEMIANDYYRAKEFVYALKAFDELERRRNDLLNNNSFTNASSLAIAKRCSCVGVIKMFMSQSCGIDELREAVHALESDHHSVQSQNIVAATRRWATGVKVYF